MESQSDALWVARLFLQANRSVRNVLPLRMLELLNTWYTRMHSTNGIVEHECLDDTADAFISLELVQKRECCARAGRDDDGSVKLWGNQSVHFTRHKRQRHQVVRPGEMLHNEEEDVRV